MWATGAKEESLNFLRQFSSRLSRDLQAESGEAPSHSGVSKHKLSELSKLLARCYFKTGEWQIELADDWGSVSFFDSFRLLYLVDFYFVEKCRGYLAFVLSFYALRPHLV
jgi:FKBP12-rapamycin complex-associated protein